MRTASVCLLRLPSLPWVARLVLLLALVGALAPTLSHARAWQLVERGPLGPICSSGVSDSTSPDPAAPAQGLSHCPLCLQPAERMAPPPLPWTPTWLPAQTARCPVLQPASRWHAIPIRHAAPRGPPALTNR